jgi:tRNA G26 N,N-dimethylase Trm1
MWNGPLHDPEFVGEMLDELKTNWDDFATASRIEGMLTVAQSVCPSLDCFIDAPTDEDYDVGAT